MNATSFFNIIRYRQYFRAKARTHYFSMPLHLFDNRVIRHQLSGNNLGCLP